MESGKNAMTPVLLQTELPGIQLAGRGKVRDIYSFDDTLLIVATDRISAFDYILGTGIPDKGRVLTRMTLFWLDFLKPLIANHLISADVGEYPAALRPFADQLEGRSMLVRKAEMIDIECVARGYLSGSGWKEYQASGTVCGIVLPSNLQESDRLPEPIFTPATKAQSGHDENISFDTMVGLVGTEITEQLSRTTLAIYQSAAEYALSRGIIIADTKFEFGFVNGELILADEVMTPDSSRFWPADQYRPGGPQPSYDKQYVRDYLEEIHWNKQPPAPALPEEVALRTSEKYKQAYRELTGRDL
jgi:phosphoribosylaminoimidazole-succinocarboxamide synthase